MSSAPSEVTFRLAPSYGIHDAREAHDWFLGLREVRDDPMVLLPKSLVLKVKAETPGALRIDLGRIFSGHSGGDGGRSK